MKRRAFLYMALLFSVLTVQLCYAEEHSQVSRVVVDLTDKNQEKVETDKTESSFYHLNKTTAYLPKTSEKNSKPVLLLGLLFCLLAIVFLIKNISFN